MEEREPGRTDMNHKIAEASKKKRRLKYAMEFQHIKRINWKQPLKLSKI